jgi:hypothetical protein
VRACHYFVLFECSPLVIEQLVRCDDVGKLPVVTYHPYKRHLGFWRMSKHAMLEIKPQLFDDLERLIGWCHITQPAQLMIARQQVICWWSGNDVTTLSKGFSACSQTN